MEINNVILPVGTVVRLKDGEKAIMITGFFPISGDNNQMFDYSACFYPEGLISSEFNMLFNHIQIEEVLHMGLINDEEKSFKEKLNIAMKEAPIQQYDDFKSQDIKDNVTVSNESIEIPIMQQQSNVTTDESIETL